jgi:hypothetical protein
MNCHRDIGISVDACLDDLDAGRSFPVRGRSVLAFGSPEQNHPSLQRDGDRMLREESFRRGHCESESSGEIDPGKGRH